MRILPTALAISAVLHTSAIAWVVTRRPTPEPPQVVRPAVEIEVVPMAVALLDDHTVATIPTQPSPASNTTGSTRATQHASTTHRGHTETPATHAPEPPHSSLMTMRHPDVPKVTHGVSGDFLSHFLDNSKPLQPKDIASERIQDDIDGANEHLHSSGWMANSSGDDIAAERAKHLGAEQERDHHELKQDGTGYKATHAGYDGNVDASGNVHFHDKKTFDANDALLRSHGIDPYASDKLRMLDDTREERYQIGKRHEKQQLAKSARIAQQNLDWMWQKLHTTAERKAALFQVWDEVAETGSDELVAGGLAARKMIVGFIRAHLTGSDAFTATELAELNAHKKSTATFDPYAD
jgi:hypothetical protein